MKSRTCIHSRQGKFDTESPCRLRRWLQTTGYSIPGISEWWALDQQMAKYKRPKPRTAKTAPPRFSMCPSLAATLVRCAPKFKRIRPSGACPLPRPRRTVVPINRVPVAADRAVDCRSRPVCRQMPAPVRIPSSAVALFVR